MSSVLEYAFNHPILNEVLDRLTLEQFNRETKTVFSERTKENQEEFKTKLKKAVLIASLLASSPIDKHKQKAIDFAVLAYLDNQNEQYASLCYVILSRTDNIQQGMHLPQVIDKEQFLIHFDNVLDFELSVARALAEIEIDEEKVYLSNFQKQLWEGLKEGDRIFAISGPTSSGKSFIVQNHFIKMCKENKGFKGIYVVPTRALIYEVSSNLRQKIDKETTQVKIAFGSSFEEDSKDIFVVTPERCLRFLKENPDKAKIDLIFFDEIQKLEDSERGVIFEYIIHELLRSNEKAKIVLAGPYLKNLNETVTKLSGIESPTVESDLTPVYQSKTIFRVAKRSKKIQIYLKSASGNVLSTELPIKKSIYSDLTNNAKQVMADFMENYGGDSSNIIYAPRKTTAEAYATSLANKKLEEDGCILQTQRVKELVDYLSDEIHPKYSLIRCLKQGIAFHHGSLPELAKMEVEQLYRNGDIKNLACTSTLLEGVNLPADKIFIFRPYINDSRRPLNDFEFGNLIGRAGRISSKLNGSVYCVELDNDQWAEKKLTSDFKKEISTATSKAFNEYKNELLTNLKLHSTKINSERAVIYTIILLRHKALRSTSELMKYLQSKNLPIDEIDHIKAEILDSVKDFEIPDEIVKLNPTIDPILQNELYSKIINEGYEEWLISRSPRHKFVGINSTEAPFSEKNFYRQFEEIANKLDLIFKIEQLVNPSGTFSKKYYTIGKIVYDSANWIQERTIKYLVDKELDGEEDDIKIIDRTILEVISHINTNVKFELVKYFSLLSDILRFHLGDKLEESDDPEREKLRKSLEYRLSLPEMIELGACSPIVLTMIRSGINRSVAIKAAKHIPQNIETDPVLWLVENKLDKLSPIFQRHIIQQGF